MAISGVRRGRRRAIALRAEGTSDYRPPVARAWPWLLGPFVEAWVRTRGSTDDARLDARRQFLEPLRGLLDPERLGHLPEVADGDSPHSAGGCPFQAWSVGEALRLDRVVLAEARPSSKSVTGRKRRTATLSVPAGIESRQ